MPQRPSLLPATFLPLACPLALLRIEIDPAPPPPPTGEMIRRWAEAAPANPRLFNGPILRFLSFNPATRTIEASRETYQRYAMQARDRSPNLPPTSCASPSPSLRLSVPPSLIHHLAVTGVITALDEHGREHVLLGRRGQSTFVYPGMWELAPGGGLESTDVYAQLLQEMEEELNLPNLRTRDLLLPPGPADLLGLSIDPNTPSVDVVVRVRLARGIGSLAPGHGEPNRSDHAWEYGSTRWVAIDALPELASEEHERIIPPTLAIWRGLGWT